MFEVRTCTMNGKLSLLIAINMQRSKKMLELGIVYG